MADFQDTPNSPLKQCGKCREFLPYTRFYRNRAMRDGLSHRCKTCHLEEGFQRNINRVKAKHPDLPGEEWRAIPGYEGLYVVSNKGRVKQLTNESKRRHQRMLKQEPTHCGYLRVTLRNRQGRKKHYSVHQLVIVAFVGEPKPEQQVNHIDGNKHHNTIENLEYCTAQENIAHAFRLGLRVGLRGTNHPRVKLTEEQVREIRRTFKPGDSYTEFGRRYGVNDGTIRAIVHRKLWKHID